MNGRILIILLVVLSTGAFAHAEEARVWTDLKGRKITAKLTGFDGNYAYLNVKGRRSKVLVDKFIQADRDYIQKRAAQAQADKAAREEAKRQERDSTIEATVTSDRGLYPRSKQEIKDRIKSILKAPVEPTDYDKDNEHAVRVLNVFRYLCGVPHDVGLKSEYSSFAKAGATLCKKLGHLDHKPKNPGMDKADYEKGYRGTSNSNLHMGSGTKGSVGSYMNDSDPSNIQHVGHRRWCLNPGMMTTGFGEDGRFSAMWSMDRARKKIPDYEAVCFPARGYMHKDYFNPDYAWSVSLNPGQFKSVGSLMESDVKVYPVKGRGDPSSPTNWKSPLSLNHFSVSTMGYGIPNCIIFRPDDIKTSARSRYWVEISNLKKKSGKKTKLAYAVEFF